MPAIPTPLPALVGNGLSGIPAPSQAEPWDVLVGGLRFMLAAGPENPLVRRGAEYRNQQVNFTGQPGEVALGFWWQRSQDSWHLGAGSPTFDGAGSGDPDIAVNRFASSFGIDPWTADEISLLHDTDMLDVVSALTANTATLSMFGGELAFWGAGSTVKQYDGTLVSDITGAWLTVQSIASDGVSLFWADVNDVWAIIVDPTPSGAAVLYQNIPATPVLLRYAKQRLILAAGPALYELEAPPGAPPVDIGTLTPLYAHPNPNWVWTDVAGGPGAIYASGYAGTSSAVFKFELDTTGALPVLTAGVVAVELPAGEQVLAMKPYIGAFIALGTSHGLRVCSFTGTDIALAPLTVVDRGPIRSVTGWDRFLYVACADAGEGYAGVLRVDLSAPTEFDRYAWAADARANTTGPSGFTGVVGETTSVVMYAGRPVFLIPGSGVFTVSATRMVPSGTVVSGRVLFGMGDPKVFQRAAFNAAGQGTVVFSTGTDTDEATVTRATVDTTQRNRLEFDLGSTRGRAIAVALTLSRPAGDVTQGPRVLSWTVRALPSQPREEQWLLPVRAQARVENRFGETVYTGVMAQLDALSELVRYQTPVLLQMFVGEIEEWRTDVVQVEDFQYEQQVAEGGWGGMVTLILRSLRGGA